MSCGSLRLADVPALVKRLLVATLAAASLVVAGSSTAAGPHPTILVKFKAGVNGPAIIEAYGDRVAGETKTHTLVVVLDSGRSAAEAVSAYAARQDDQYAEQNMPVQAALAAPSDPSYSSQWALGTIRALDGWTRFPGAYHVSGGPIIGVVDSGVDATNPDLADGRVLTGSGANCLSGSCVPNAAADDSWGHGTHVAGIAAAATDNAVGVAGVAFDSAILPVKVLDSTGIGSVAGLATGIIWAADHGARVINVSITTQGYSSTLCDAVSYAASAGALVVAAAGNDATFTNAYPAACPGAIGIAATDQNDQPASFSNYGYPNVFAAAPGASILSTLRGNTYGTASGTSMAAPFVSGLAALLVAQDTSRSVADVKRIIARTASKVGSGAYAGDRFNACGGGCSWTSSHGYGRIDVAAALTYGSTPHFSLSASPTTATITAGASASYATAVGADTGYAGNVALSVTGLPSGATATYTPAAVTAPGSSQLTITTLTSTPAGTYPLTISGSDSAGTESAGATLVVAPPDFSVTTSPTAATVLRGKTTTISIPVGSIGGFAGTVALSASGAPSGVTASFAPSSVVAPGSSMVTLTASTSAVLGAYTLTVKGVSGAITHTATVALTVAIPDFTVSGTPASATVLAGQTATFGVSVGVLDGFTGNIAMTLTGAPTGSTVSYAPSSVVAPGSSTLTVKTAATALGNTYTLTITGTSSTKIVHKASVTLTVLAPDFAVSASPASATVLAGQTATFGVSVGVLNGFTGNIAMTLTGAPTGSTVSYAPSSVVAPGSSTLTVKTAATALGNTYTLTITGTSSTRIVHKASVTLTVLAPDFAVSASPASATILQGQTAAYPLAVDVLNGFSGNIALSVTGYPSGSTVAFAPSSVAAPGSSTLTLKTTGTTAVGTYTLTVTGKSSANVIRTVKVTLVVEPAGDFGFSASATTITVKRGAAVTLSTYLNGLGGFYATVSLSNSTLPAGMTATWGRTSQLVSGTSTLSVSLKLAATTATPPGTYTVNLVGTCGSLVHTVPLTVVVT